MTNKCVTNESNISCISSECTSNSNIHSLPLLEVLSSDRESPTKLIYIVTVNILFVISIINNLLSLQTYLCSQKIRITNVGIYLIGFTLTSLISTILMELELYLNMQPAISYNRRTILHDMVTHLGLWLSSFIAVERVCIECFHQSLYASRKRALIVITLFTLFVVLTKLPIFLGRRPPTSSSNDLTSIATMCNSVFEHIHHLTPIVLHILSSLLVLCHISTHRIHILNIRKRYCCSILCQQLDKHRDFFVPSFIYILCNTPYHIWTEEIYKKCSSDRITSIRIYVALLLITNIYYTFTFLIYVCPSRIYFAEFKQTSIIGKCLKRLQGRGRKKNHKIAVLSEI